jgi:hypothetical protein
MPTPAYARPARPAGCALYEIDPRNGFATASARRTYGEFFPRMRTITIKLAGTWHYRRMRPCVEPSNGLAPLSPFPSWPDYIINTSGYDFRKGQDIGLPAIDVRCSPKSGHLRVLTGCPLCANSGSRHLI